MLFRSNLHGLDAVVLAVAHSDFEELTLDKMSSLYRDDKRVLLDIKGILDRKNYEEAGYMYWRL